jgi:hypothetical protein
MNVFFTSSLSHKKNHFVVIIYIFEKTTKMIKYILFLICNKSTQIVKFVTIIIFVLLSFSNAASAYKIPYNFAIYTVEAQSPSCKINKDKLYNEFHSSLKRPKINLNVQTNYNNNLVYNSINKPAFSKIILPMKKRNQLLIKLYYQMKN